MALALCVVLLENVNISAHWRGEGGEVNEYIKPLSPFPSCALSICCAAPLDIYCCVMHLRRMQRRE